MNRFYKDVSVSPVGDGFAVLLDGRGIKTPAGKAFIVPTQKLADAIADEWRAQGETVEPTTMPLLRLSNTAIDGISANRPQTIDAILRYGDNDLLCYRAHEPPALAGLQAEGWDPLLAWVDATHGARLTVVAGVTHADQPPAALAALRAAVEGQDDYALAGLHVIASITGSLVLALAAAAGQVDAPRAFALSRIDENYQAGIWGMDAEAEARANHLAQELGHAFALMALSR
ncbi:MAG: ATPase [Alphaproteobacteria bacterium]|nr:ATPase [Alphaproteobacteria bacterium]